MSARADIVTRLRDWASTICTVRGDEAPGSKARMALEACSEIESLREQLRVMTEEHRAACEDRDEIMRERDEARRECCTWQGLESGRRKEDVAASRGWGYLRWPDQDALDRLAKLDEECGL